MPSDECEYLNVIHFLTLLLKEIPPGYSSLGTHVLRSHDLMLGLFALCKISHKFDNLVVQRKVNKKRGNEWSHDIHEQHCHEKTYRPSKFR